MKNKLFYKFNKILIIFALTLVANFAPAAQKKVNANVAVRSLLASEFRPSMQEVVDEFGGRIPRTNINLLEDAHIDSYWIPSVQELLPKAIAKLEYIYPGAIWASLGRDAVPITDLLDAFYIGLGQSGRAVAISASTDTFESSPESMFVRMLIKLGMDIRHSKEMRPFVVIDRTSYNRGRGRESQSTRLMKYVYSYFTEKTNRSAKYLVEKVGVVSTSSGRYVHNRKEFFQALKKSSAKNGYPSFIAQVDELANFTDKDEWHDTFGELVRFEDGSIGGNPGALAPLESRKKVLRMMVDAYQVVTTRQFQDAVRAEAKALGYDFDRHLQLYAKKGPLKSGSEVYMDNESLVDASIENFFKVKQELSIDLIGFHGTIKETYVAQIVDLLDEKEKKKELSVKARQAIVDAELQKIKESIKAATVPSMSPFEHLMATYLKSFSKFEPYKNQYFSDNAEAIKDEFNKLIEIANKTEYILGYLRVLEIALKDGSISSKDYRRLILYALGHVYVLDKDFYNGLPKLFKQSPILKSYLIKHSRVYLTSKKNGGQAGVIYVQMQSKNMIPKSPACDVVLGAEEEE